MSLISCSFFEAVDTGTLFQYLIYLISFTLWPTFKPNFAVPYYLVAFTAQLGYMVYAYTPFISIIFMFGMTVFCVVGNYIKFAAYMDKNLAIEKLELLAEYDTLTELFNRRGMRKRSGLLMDYSARVHSPVTVAMVDVDFSKATTTLTATRRGTGVYSWLPAVFGKTSAGGRTFPAATAGKNFSLYLSVRRKRGRRQPSAFAKGH